MDEMLAQILAYVRGMWRYRWVALVVAWAVAVAGWVYVSQMPDQYRVSAQVHVDTESVLRPLLTGLAVEPNTNQRVDMLTRTLLTRPNLEQVARATDMHLQAFTEQEIEEVIDGLRRNLSIQTATTVARTCIPSHTPRRTPVNPSRWCKPCSTPL
jgi:uncharacterized protein involved in exopolysaccharide biosynthesis